MICKSRRRMKCRTCLACTIACCIMSMGLTGCSDRKVSDKPAINIEPYAMTVHERATVKEGNISSQIKLTLKPDGFSSKDYSVKQDDFEVDQINVKATTEEGLGFTGSGEGISAQAVCILE